MNSRIYTVLGNSNQSRRQHKSATTGKSAIAMLTVERRCTPLSVRPAAALRSCSSPGACFSDDLHVMDGYKARFDASPAGEAIKVGNHTSTPSGGPTRSARARAMLATARDQYCNSGFCSIQPIDIDLCVKSFSSRWRPCATTEPLVEVIDGDRRA